MNTDTPRTDNQDFFFVNGSLGHTETAVDVEFARQLERELIAATTWRPIETAPRDGTRILAYRSGFAELLAIIFWSSDFDIWTPVHGNSWLSPTHWMSLPPPPKTSWSDSPIHDQIREAGLDAP